MDVVPKPMTFLNIRLTGNFSEVLKYNGHGVTYHVADVVPVLVTSVDGDLGEVGLRLGEVAEPCVAAVAIKPQMRPASHLAPTSMVCLPPPPLRT